MWLYNHVLISSYYSVTNRVVCGEIVPIGTVHIFADAVFFLLRHQKMLESFEMLDFYKDESPSVFWGYGNLSGGN